MFPIAAATGIGSLLAGFLTPEQEGPQLPPEIQRMLKQAWMQYNQTRSFGNAPVMSDVQSRQALASQEGALGGMLDQKRQQAMAGFDPANAGNLGDFLSNMSGMETGARMGLQQQASQQDLLARQQAKYQTAPNQLYQMMNATTGARQQLQPNQNNDIAGLLGGLASSFGYMNAQKKTMPGQSANTSINSGGMGGGGGSASDWFGGAGPFEGGHGVDGIGGPFGSGDMIGGGGARTNYFGSQQNSGFGGGMDIKALMAALQKGWV